MAITKIEIEHFDKEYLIFAINQLTGLPPDIGSSYRIHRYVIKTEDAIKLFRFLEEDKALLACCEEDAHERGA